MWSVPQAPSQFLKCGTANIEGDMHPLDSLVAAQNLGMATDEGSAYRPTVLRLKALALKQGKISFH